MQSAVALSSARMYSNILSEYNITPDFIYPQKLKNKNMVEHSLSGNLMGLTGMTEMLDVEYFRDDMKTALMFGTLTEGNHRLANIKIVGRKFSINISDQETSVMIDDEEFLKGNGGKFVIRQFIENERGRNLLFTANRT